MPIWTPLFVVIWCMAWGNFYRPRKPLGFDREGNEIPGVKKASMLRVLLFLITCVVSTIFYPKNAMIALVVYFSYVWLVWGNWFKSFLAVGTKYV